MELLEFIWGISSSIIGSVLFQFGYKLLMNLFLLRLCLNFISSMCKEEKVVSKLVSFPLIGLGLILLFCLVETKIIGLETVTDVYEARPRGGGPSVTVSNAAFIPSMTAMFFYIYAYVIGIILLIKTKLNKPFTSEKEPFKKPKWLLATNKMILIFIILFLHTVLFGFYKVGLFWENYIDYFDKIIF